MFNEMLDAMFSSFDHHVLSSAEQGFGNVERCSVKCSVRLTGALVAVFSLVKPHANIKSGLVC